MATDGWLRPVPGAPRLPVIVEAPAESPQRATVSSFRTPMFEDGRVTDGTARRGGVSVPALAVQCGAASPTGLEYYCDGTLEWRVLGWDKDTGLSQSKFPLTMPVLRVRTSAERGDSSVRRSAVGILTPEEEFTLRGSRELMRQRKTDMEAALDYSFAIASHRRQAAALPTSGPRASRLTRAFCVDLIVAILLYREYQCESETAKPRRGRPPSKARRREWVVDLERAAVDPAIPTLFGVGAQQAWAIFTRLRTGKGPRNVSIESVVGEAVTKCLAIMRCYNEGRAGQVWEPYKGRDARMRDFALAAGARLDEGRTTGRDGHQPSDGLPDRFRASAPRGDGGGSALAKDPCQWVGADDIALGVPQPFRPGPHLEQSTVVPVLVYGPPAVHCKDSRSTAPQGEIVCLSLAHSRALLGLDATKFKNVTRMTGVDLASMFRYSLRSDPEGFLRTELGYSHHTSPRMVQFLPVGVVEAVAEGICRCRPDLIIADSNVARDRWLGVVREFLRALQNMPATQPQSFHYAVFTRR